MVERRFRLTHKIYAIEPTIQVHQAPTPEPKIYIETVYKDAPPLPHPVISLDTPSSRNLSNHDAGNGSYLQYHTSLSSELIATREGSLEDLENYPEYRLKDEIDASEGRYEARKYADRFRKISLRKEVHAVIVFEPPPQPPHYYMDWTSLFQVVVPAILVIFVGFGVLNVKSYQRNLEHKSETKKRLELPKTGLPLGWILRHIDLQNAYHSETQRLKSKVNRLRNKVANQRTRIRVLTTQKVENRFKNTFLNSQLKGLAEKVTDLDRELGRLKSLHDLTMAMADPEVVFTRRFEQDMADAEEKYLERIGARPGKARSSPLQWWEEQQQDIALAIKYIERKGSGRNWRIRPEVVERLRRKGLLEPGALNRPAPSQKVLDKRAFIMKG